MKYIAGEIANIYYTDAYYGNDPRIPLGTELPRGEANGFTFEEEDRLLVHFIKKADKEIVSNYFLKGLIIPKNFVGKEIKTLYFAQILHFWSKLNRSDSV